MTTPRTIYKSRMMTLRAARTACCVGIGALLLSSCSSPPKPPSVDESTKRPVNAQAAVDLKTCQGDLSRATILVSEMALANAMATALTKALPQQGVDKESAAMTGAADSATAHSAADTTGNLVAVVSFGIGSAAWAVEPADAAALVRRAKDAAVILIRGRTDATGDSLQETALARRRAEAAAEFLQLAGVSKGKLRLTWQGAGDPVAGLRPADRSQSRRVEIEFYTAAPMFVNLRSGAANGKGATVASL
jgi:outer membrane protein OmpA-like peptidoglycan-associated protein